MNEEKKNPIEFLGRKLRWKDGAWRLGKHVTITQDTFGEYTLSDNLLDTTEFAKRLPQLEKAYTKTLNARRKHVESVLGE